MMPATKTEVTVTISEKKSRPNKFKAFIPPEKSPKKLKTIQFRLNNKCVIHRPATASNRGYRHFGPAARRMSVEPVRLLTRSWSV